MNRIYACIDLKSFYASVECHERGLNPITTNLVVADKERTEKTICLAVSPSLKSYGLSGRARLFEVVSRVREVNNERRLKIKNKRFIGKSFNNEKIKKNDLLELDYLIAKPRMALYIKYSSDIYNVYLKYLSKDDIYVYSIDEVFCDLTDYLNYYKMSAEELVTKMILSVEKETGITATGGIGSNLYLAKVAMDIMAKHTEPNKAGVRIAYLDEISYRQKLWNHTPLTDFWRVGRGYANRLLENKIYTMGDICRLSIENEDKLFKMFGVNAEILIDHAWGIESCTLKDIKAYKPKTNSLSNGQVLHEPYPYLKTKIVVLEMIDSLVLNMVDKGYVTNELVLTINYDSSNINEFFNGDIKKDYYGRGVPKEAHGSIKIDHYTASYKVLSDKTIELFEKIINPSLLVRRINIAVCNLIKSEYAQKIKSIKQIDLFTNLDEYDQQKKEDDISENKEVKVEKAIIDIKKKYGKNAILKGMNFIDGATSIERNKLIGGHHE